MRSLIRRLLVVVALCASAPTLAAAEFPLRDGDVWVFAGDSITYQRIHTTYIEAFCRTRFPKWKLRFRNSGVGGDWAHRVLARFDHDVAHWKPTMVSIELGMNDVKGGEDGAARYIADIKQLIARSRAIGSRCVLIGSSPRSDGWWGRNLLIKKYTSELQKLAAQEKLPFVDQINVLLPRWSANYAPMQMCRYMEPSLKAKAVPHLAELQAWYAKWRKSDQWPVDLGNVVHPNHAGQLMMAYVILNGLGAPPLVSRAAVDARASKVVGQEGCVLTGLQCAPGRVRFMRQDERLPMPIDDRARAALRMFREIQEISQYHLTVTGLDPGNYAVMVDGKPAAVVASAELAKGWNATTVAKGPIADQCRRVLAKIQEKVDHVDLYRRALKTQLGKTDAHVGRGKQIDAAKAKEILAASRKRMDALDAEVSALVRPLPHTYELSRQAEPVR